jgi:hypothetical protein
MGTMGNMGMMGTGVYPGTGMMGSPMGTGMVTPMMTPVGATAI